MLCVSCAVHACKASSQHRVCRISWVSSSSKGVSVQLVPTLHFKAAMALAYLSLSLDITAPARNK
jgi:hypothetical protein